MPSTTKLDLNIEVDVLTPGAAADTVNAILEFLLYQRNQIPLVYNTYKYYVGLWAKRAEEHDVAFEEEVATTLSGLQLERQRCQATQTKDAISELRMLIYKSFESNDIKSVRFLFGSTAFTPKEAYTIHIPTEAISRKHSHDHHRIPPAHLNQALISLITSEDLYSIFSHNLGATNLFMELETLKVSAQTSSGTKIFPKDICLLPASCKDIHFHLTYTRSMNFDTKLLKCCQELDIFEDIMHLTFNENPALKTPDETQKSDTPETRSTWWEADIIVRGFKEKPVKGHNIWTA